MLLLQLWVPQDTPGGLRLTTQGFPFALLGSADTLTLYRYYSGKFPGLNSKSRFLCCTSSCNGIFLLLHFLLLHATAQTSTFAPHTKALQLSIY
jgi:hypothetical protein